MQRAPDPPRRPRPARARRARRRARLLRGDLPRRRVGASTASRRDFVQDNHSRSRRGTLRGIHFQTAPGPGQARARARAGACSTSSSTCAAARRRSASGRRSSSTTSAGASCGSRSASGTASACSREVADFVYKCTSYYDPATEAGIRFDDPDVGIEWPRRRRAALLRARPRPRRGWPRSPTTLPFTRVSGDGRFAPSPTGDAAPRQPAHRAAGVAVRALGGRAVPGADGGPRPGPRAAGARRASSSRDLAAIGLDWDGEVVVQSRAARRCTRRRSPRCGCRARLRVLLHAGGDPRGGVGRRTGRCPRAPTPARACG